MHIYQRNHVLVFGLHHCYNTQISWSDRAYHFPLEVRFRNVITSRKNYLLCMHTRKPIPVLHKTTYVGLIAIVKIFWGFTKHSKWFTMMLWNHVTRVELCHQILNSTSFTPLRRVTTKRQNIHGSIRKLCMRQEI